MRVCFSKLNSLLATVPLFCIALASLFSYALPGYSIATEVLEVAFFVFFVYSINEKSKFSFQRLSLISALALYFFGSAAFITYNDINILDFLQAYKAYYYLICFLVIVSSARSAYLNDREFRLVVDFMLAVFLAKYVIDWLLGVSRPSLFTENNFEIIFLLLIYYFLESGNKNLSFVRAGAIILVSLLSGSRSSTLATVFAFLFIIIPRLKFSRKNIIHIIFVVITGLISWLVFYATFFFRLGESDIQDIDRIRFFYLFLYEIEEWGLTDYLIGAPRITPLSQSTCATLSFYHTLFSYSGNGTCYSVILHSYILRALFDHGILFFGMLLYGYVYLLNFLSYKPIQILGFLSILMITSLSVSGPNSIYTAYAMLLIVLAGKGRMRCPRLDNLR